MMIRGYSVKQQLNFLQTQYEPAISRQLLERIPAEVRSALPDLKAGEWYPRAYSVSILRAIASRHGQNEKALYNDLVRCGTFIAAEATNTFLKLLMKVLTPALFAKKIPEFWKRDQTGGHFEVDTTSAGSGCIQLTLNDVAGFDHIAIVSIGWIQFGMSAMGKTDVTVSQTGWTIGTPAPESITYELRWS